MDSTNPDPDGGVSHVPERTRRRSLVVIGLFALMMLAALVVFTWLGGGGRTLVLPNGATMKFAGIGRGYQVPAANLRGSIAVDMDGAAWRHDYAPALTWRDHAHRLAPLFVQRYLPPGRRALPAGSHTAPYAEMTLWESNGSFLADGSRLTWEDENGYESEGTGHPPMYRGRSGQMATGTLPPSRSPKVILRVREYQEDQPVNEWPLIAELPMNNPCLLRTPMPVVDKLPVTRTQHGVSLTLERITVNPKAPDHERTTLTVSMPTGNVQDWSTGFQFFDERGTEVMFSHTGFGTRPGGILLSTASSLWTDAPWHVRVTLTPRAGLPPVLGAQFRFLKMPLPGKTRPAGSFPREETAGGHSVTLTDLITDPTRARGDVVVMITRPDLPPTRRYRIVSATDNMGRTYKWRGGHRSSYLSTGNVNMEYPLHAPEGPAAETLDIVFAIEEPITFDFCVMPEFQELKK